jgi:hypothetical protein
MASTIPTGMNPMHFIQFMIEEKKKEMPQTIPELQFTTQPLLL